MGGDRRAFRRGLVSAAIAGLACASFGLAQVDASGSAVYRITPTDLDFGDVALGGTSPDQSVTVTNVSPAPLVVSMAGGAGGDFGGFQDCQGKSLNPGDSCHITYQFTPPSLGSDTGSTGGSINGQAFSFTFKGNGVEGFRISPTSFDFGDITMGSTSPDQQVTVTNVTSKPQLISMAGGAGGAFGGFQDCQGKTLNPGASCHITYQFTPAGAGPVTGSTSGTVNGQAFNFSFKGDGVAKADLLISPVALDFGDVTVGTTSPDQQVTVTNVSSSPKLISMAGGAAGDFGGFQDCQGKTLQPGDSCHITYQFTPPKAGADAGSTGGSINGQSFSFSFAGNGVAKAAFRISPTALDFGDVTVGTTSPDQQVTVTNVSSSPKVISMAGGAAGDFGGFQDCQGKTLQPGDSCHITYQFTPPKAGADAGSTGGNINGQSFSFSLAGNGVARAAFLISPTALDFGDVEVGTTSPDQQIAVTNVSSSPQVVSMAGGAAGDFGGFQDCQGKTLQPGDSCHITYQFSPPTFGLDTGSTGGSINGQAFSFNFRGNGVFGASEADFLITPTALDFGDVVVGTTSADQSVTVTNVSSSAHVVSMAGGAAGDFGGFQDCQGKTLNPGDSCHITYQFTPPGAGPDTGSTGGSINGQVFSFAFKGNGLALNPFLISPTGFDFGDVGVGTTSANQSVTVTNVSSSARVVSMAGGAAGDFGGFQDCQGKSLQPGDSCHITYQFTPPSLGPDTGGTGGSVNGQSFSFSFKGNGIAASPFLISPTGFDFGDVGVGTTSANQSVTVTNVSSSPRVVSMAGGAAGDFGGFQDCQGKTLNPGDSCHITYQFTPPSLGPDTGGTGGTGGTVNGQSFSFSFKGNGIAASPFLISPTGFDFGDVTLGSVSPNQVVTVKNVSQSPRVVSMAGGAAGDFGGFQNCQGKTLNPGDTCQITYQFTPPGLGPDSGSTGGSINGQSFSFTFKGNGIRQFLITPVGFDFGEVFVGTTSPQQTVNVKNLANQPVVVSMAGGAAGVFGGVQNCQGNTLNPGQSCQIFYAFTPAAAGHVTGTTSGSVNGQSFSFSFQGTGLGDNTPPVITASVQPPSPDGSNGWYHTAPAVSWSVIDLETPISSTTGCSPTTVTADTPSTGVTLTCTATSGGGTSSKSVVIRHDATPPTITCPAPPTFVIGSVASLTATVTDSSSGPVSASVTVPASTATAGPHTVAVSAADIAGNTASTSCSYVVGYAFSPFIQPGDRVVNSGSSIPVVFALNDAGGNPIPDADASALAANCSVKITFSGAPGTVVCATYDADEHRFHGTVNTAKSLAPNTYQLTVQVMAGGVVVTTSSTNVRIR